MCEGGREAGTTGQTDGRTDGRTEGRRDGGTEGRRDGGTEGRSDGGTEGRRDGGTEGRMGLPNTWDVWIFLVSVRAVLLRNLGLLHLPFISSALFPSFSPPIFSTFPVHFNLPLTSVSLKISSTPTSAFSSSILLLLVLFTPAIFLPSCFHKHACCLVVSLSVPSSLGLTCMRW